jgi:hypothetical protein
MMRRLALGGVLALTLLLSACGKAAPPPPPAPSSIQLEGIDYPAIKAGKLYGGGCNFVADGGGMSALVLAQETEAIIKLKGEIVRIPADTTSRLLPESARTRYANAKQTLILAPLPGAVPTENGVVQSLPVRLAIVDSAGQPQFNAKGLVQCKPM